MPSLALEGSTLGQKQEHYNSIVRTATADETFRLESINYDERDIDNLLRIDVACGRRDVDYVLEVLRGGDPLYTAHALKRSAWLITDDEFSHIVNPHFFQRELFPKVNTKVKHQILLAIRLHLKNEARVDEFYNFYNDDFEFAQQWLPRCSDTLVLSVLEKYVAEIHVKLLKRLCRKSVAILKACCEIYPSPHWLSSGITFLYTHPEAYLELLTSAEVHNIPKFKKKATRVLISKYPNVILDHFYRYCNKIDLPEFAKHFTTVEVVRHLILKQTESDHHEARTWCKHKHLKYLIRQIPKDQQYQFVRELIINKRKVDASSGSNSDEEDNNSCNLDLYPFYRYLPFKTVFFELKDVVFGRTSVKNESEFGLFELMDPIGSSNIQTWILKIMIRSARGNTSHIQTLLRHYRDNHVIEPYDDPMSSLLCKITKTHKYDETTWNMLNDIFYSMGIYREDRNITVPYCIQAIVTYNILHDIQNPKVIEQKIKLLNFRSLPQKLEPDESDKVFAYLYKYAYKEMISTEIKNKSDLERTLLKCGELIQFLQDWKRNVSDFPDVLNKIKELIRIKSETTWGTDSDVQNVFYRFYKENRLLRIHLFQESLFFCLNDETCLNALKHDPDLFSCNNSWIEVICSTESVSLRRTLLKLRIYWSHSETKPWVDGYLSALKRPTVNRACVEGLFILVPSKEALTLVDKYVSEVTEIDSLLLIISRYMGLLRPSVGLDTAWSYLGRNTVGHAAQFLGPIMFKSGHAEATPFAIKLLVMTGPLQKLGIRYLLSRCNANVSKQLILDVWNNYGFTEKNNLFERIYKYLLKNKRTIEVENAWEILSILIDNMTAEFYDTLQSKIDRSNIQKVNASIRLIFFKKCYQFVLPQLLSNDQYMIKCYMTWNVEHFDVNFVESLVLNTLDKFFVKDTASDHLVSYHRTDTLRFLTAYLTSNDGIESQQIKFEKLVVLLMDSFVKVWPKDNINKMSEGYKEILRRFLESLSLNVSKRLTKQFVIPSNLYRNIQTYINDKFSLQEDYFLITFWNVSVIFVEILDNISKSGLYDSIFHKLKHHYSYRYEDREFVELLSNIAPSFAQACSKYFKQDKILSQCPALYPLASKSLTNAFISLSFPYSVMYKTLKHMLVDEKSEILYHVANGVIRCTAVNSGHGEYKYFVDEELKSIILSHPSRVIRANYHYSNSRYSNNYDETHNTYWRRYGFMKTYGPNDMDVY